MSANTLAAASIVLEREDPEPGSARRAATATDSPTSTAPVPHGDDRSPESLALLLARAAERVRTDPEAHFAHCAVRGAAEVLRARLDERMPVSRGASAGMSRGRSVDA